MGDCYNPQTGMFVASVSGTFLFLISVTSKPDSDNEKAEIEIVLEGEPIGYTLCDDDSKSSTGHAVTYVKAGQRVWLRTFHETSSFEGSRMNCFTGTLLMPSV